MKTFGLVSAVAVLAFVSPLSAHAQDMGSDSAQIINVASKGETQDALNFVKATAEKGLTFLSNPNATLADKKTQFRKLLDGHFDLDTISRFSLGRYWNTANAAERKEYTRLFKNMVVSVYSNRFDQYKGEKFEVKGARSVSDTDTLVSSVIIPANGGENVTVDWRVRKKGGSYRIVDVLVAGVSMSVTQRSEFASIIQRGGGNVSALIDHLKTGGKA